MFSIHEVCKFNVIDSASLAHSILLVKLIGKSLFICYFVALYGLSTNSDNSIEFELPNTVLVDRMRHFTFAI